MTLGGRRRRRRPATSTLRKVTHRTIDEVTRLVEAHRFNVAIARMMELINAARKAIDSGAGAGDPAVREAAETLARHAVARRAVHRRGDVGAARATSRRSRRPAGRSADPALLVQESVTCVVQVAGKVRDRLEVSPDIAEDELERLALASEKVRAALGGRGIRKVIVRAPKIVNIVPA